MFLCKKRLVSSFPCETNQKLTNFFFDEYNPETDKYLQSYTVMQRNLYISSDFIRIPCLGVVC